MGGTTVLFQGGEQGFVVGVDAATFGEGTLRAAFTDGLDAVAVAAGSTAVVAGMPVLALVRSAATKSGVTGSGSRALTEETTEGREGRSAGRHEGSGGGAAGTT